MAARVPSDFKTILVTFFVKSSPIDPLRPEDDGLWRFLSEFEGRGAQDAARLRHLRKRDRRQRPSIKQTRCT